MPGVKPIQYEVLFNNAFGGEAGSMGVEVVETDNGAVGRVGDKVVSLLVVQGRALEWQVDGQTLAPFATLTPDSPKRAENGAALRAALGIPA